jgi:hypothetical protein
MDDSRHLKEKCRMKRAVTILFVSLLICTPLWAGELKKLSLDDASSIGLKIQTDAVMKVEGKGSVRITTLWPTVVCLGEVTGLPIENAKLIYQARVRSELEGAAFLELWAHLGGGQYFSKGVNNPIQGKSDWRTIQTPFLFQKGQRPEKLTLNVVINGKGTLWIDDIVLSQEPLK